MKMIKKGLIALVAISALASCEKGGVFCYKGDGNIVTEERNLTGFDAIGLSTSADVFIEQGEDYEVKIETSENLLEIIETEVKGTKLKIKLKKGKCIKNNHTLNVFITMPTLNGIDVSGSGDIRVQNLMMTDKMDISVSGSGDIEFDSLKVNDFEASISGSGELFVNGIDTAYSQQVSISGSGDINTLQMPVRNADLSISGSGECKVNVTESLVARISGSGDIRYKGTPTVDGKTSGSGSIKPY